MIKSDYNKLIPKSIGSNNILKILKGSNLIWKKITFKKIQSYTWDKVSFNGSSKNKLPLNTKLLVKIWNGSYKTSFGGRIVHIKGSTIILKNKYKSLVIESASGGKVEYSIEENENEKIENCYILE